MFPVRVAWNSRNAMSLLKFAGAALDKQSRVVLTPLGPILWTNDFFLDISLQAILWQFEMLRGDKIPLDRELYGLNDLTSIHLLRN